MYKIIREIFVEIYNIIKIIYNTNIINIMYIGFLLQ